MSYPVGRSLWGGAIAGGLWLAGACVVAAWATSSGWTWRQGLALAVLVATGLWAAVGWWRQPAGHLEWDGASWRWHPAHAQAAFEGGAMRPLADLQEVLLVEWSAPGRRAWFWLERRAHPHRWAALRRAVYSRADPTHALTGTPPPSARP